MRVLAMVALREFWERHPHAEGPLRAWYKVLSLSAPQNFTDLKATFGTVDYVRDRHDTVGWHVFDVGGNNYRVICKLDYAHQFALIKEVFDHTDYDRWTAAIR
jgi:mRNA interferase HigB